MGSIISYINEIQTDYIRHYLNNMSLYNHVRPINSNSNSVSVSNSVSGSNSNSVSGSGSGSIVNVGDFDGGDDSEFSADLTQKYYKLYIFVESDVVPEIKSQYILNADKHNKIIDKYLNSLRASDDDNDVTNNEGKELCFDSGFDLICPDENVINGLQTQMIDHKIKCCMKTINDKFVAYYLYSRSSTASKTPLRLANGVGIFDSGYRGNICAIMDNINTMDIGYVLKSNTRYVQICSPNLEYPMKVFIVDAMSELGKNTERGDGGFGSTGA